MSENTESIAPEAVVADESPRDPQRVALEAMRMAELQALASELQIVGAGKLRKGELVDAVTGARQSAVTMPSTGRRRGSRRVSASDPSEFAGVEVAAGAPEPENVDADAVGAVAATDEVVADTAAAESVDDGAEGSDTGAAADDSGESNDGGDAESGTTGSRSRRSRSRNRQGGQGANGQQNGQSQGNQNQNGPSTQTARDADDDRSARTTRTRDRKRGRGPLGDDQEPELLDDDVLIPIAGILDVLENYAFVRTSGYLPGPTDIYVSLGQVKKYGMRKGDAVVGAIRQPREHEQQGRQKYNALVKVDSVNGLSLESAATRVEFEALTPLSPDERLRLETTSDVHVTRMIDLFAPIGKGQRGLIVSPPKSGKTVALQAIAEAISRNSPDVHLMVVLVDERPEEVTELQRTVRGEVIASTFDRPAEDHTTVAELAVERAKRLVELGHDVVVLLDSLSRLGRAYASIAAPGRTGVGIDPASLHPAKRIFGAARKAEEGGSLTIIATAAVETGSRADEIVFDEFAGTANMELRLSRSLAELRRYPAVVIAASSTRREERLLGADEVSAVWSLRRSLEGLDERHALESVVARLSETESNVELLMQVQRAARAGE
jgi:transcription termination factor Rho